jgi:hypothetical protein
LAKVKLKVLKVDDTSWIDGMYPIKVKVFVGDKDFDFTIRVFEEDIKGDGKEEAIQFVTEYIKKWIRDYTKKQTRRREILYKLKEIEGTEMEIELDC